MHVDEIDESDESGRHAMLMCTQAASRLSISLVCSTVVRDGVGVCRGVQYALDPHAAASYVLLCVVLPRGSLLSAPIELTGVTECLRDARARVHRMVHLRSLREGRPTQSQRCYPPSVGAMRGQSHARSKSMWVRGQSQHACSRDPPMAGQSAITMKRLHTA